MKARVLASRQDAEIFLARVGDDDYCVLSLDDTTGIEVGDVLQGKFDGHGSLFYSVTNVTQKNQVRICLENWECSVGAAVDCLLQFGSSPARVLVAGESFVANSDDVVRQIRDAISRA